MTEDCDIGFLTFSLQDGTSIANETAVLRASSHLYNETACEKSSPHLGKAIQAVQDVIRGRGIDQDPGLGDQNQTHFTDAVDFIL